MARNAAGRDAVPELVGSEAQDRGQADAETADQAPEHAGAARARELVDDDEVCRSARITAS